MQIAAGSRATIQYCTFEYNTSDWHGGAITNNLSSPSIENCIFSNNNGEYGGAIGNLGSSPRIINCLFAGNKASMTFIAVIWNQGRLD